MTPAVKQVEKHNIQFSLHQYHHDESAASYGLEAAEKLSVPAEQVFKTLVIQTNDDQLAVAIIPVLQKLNLKAIAKALKVKKVSMAEAKRVESTTGYVLGGVSPLGQKKRLPTLVNSSCQALTTLFISGGKRGLEIELSPKDLIQLTQAKVADIGV